MKTAMKSIRQYCLECSGGVPKEARNCNITNCPLYPYRFGRKPTEDEKASLQENLTIESATVAKNYQNN